MASEDKEVRPSGVARAEKAFGAKFHAGRDIRKSQLASADEMRSRVKRKRYPYNIAVVGPQGSGKTTLIKTIAATMSSGVPEEALPSPQCSSLDTTIVYSRHMSLALIDTPGDPAQRRTVLTALTQADAVLFVVSCIPDAWKDSTKAGEWQEYVKLIRAADKGGAVFTVINKIDAGFVGRNPQNTAQSYFMRCAMPLRRYFEKILRGVRAQDYRASGVCRNHALNNAKMAKNRMFCLSGQEDWGVTDRWSEGPQNIYNHMNRLGGSLVRFLNGFGHTGYALNKEVRQLMLDRVRKQPLRILIDDVYYAEEGWVAVGKISSGAVKVGEEINISPGGVVTTCKSIKFQNADFDAPNFTVNKAVAGERVEITIGEKGLSANMIFAGSVMGRVQDTVDAPETVCDFKATVHILYDAKDWCINVKQKNVGSAFRGAETTEQSFDFGLDSYPAYFEQLLGVINPRTGRTVIENPEEVTAGQTVECVVRISTAGIPLDEYALYPDTGRFMVRSDKGTGRLVAVGRITEKVHI